MENVHSNRITPADIFNNQFDYNNIISIFPISETKNWERCINNLILTKIEENFDTHCENITTANYEILVYFFKLDILYWITIQN
jgi:hypothetical protein